MSDLSFVFLSIKSRFLNCLLSILLTAFGVSIALIILQFSNHLDERLKKDNGGVDIVVGAKGSPLQLVLSSIYHIDYPNGNIPFEGVKKIMNNPQVDKAIPIALGDNWKRYRIVGTQYDFLDLYNAKIDRGQIWKNKYEIVVGSDVDLNLLDEIHGSHGLYESDNIHENEKYIVVGKLNSTGTVIDRLIITSINSVLDIHGFSNIETHHDHEEHEDDKHKHEEHKDGFTEIHEEDHAEHQHDTQDREYDENEDKKTFSAEITALLIKTKSPVSNINLPRQINRENSFLAAVPANEITRFVSMLGFGSKSFKLLSIILIIVAALSIFSGLAANLQNRMTDLAILRALGYSKNRIFKMICIEGITIVTMGLIVGILFGLILLSFFIGIISPLNQSNMGFIFAYDLLFLIIVVLFSGLLAALFPAYKASKVSVADQLSRNV